MESEIALIKRRIELECEALRQALDGLAVVASHQSIMARYERLGACRAELERLIGPGAGEIVCELYSRCMG